jgi:hypothetical protein
MASEPFIIMTPEAVREVLLTRVLAQGDFIKERGKKGGEVTVYSAEEKERHITYYPSPGALLPDGEEAVCKRLSKLSDTSIEKWKADSRGYAGRDVDKYNKVIDIIARLQTAAMAHAENEKHFGWDHGCFGLAATVAYFDDESTTVLERAIKKGRDLIGQGLYTKVFLSGLHVHGQILEDEAKHLSVSFPINHHSFNDWDAWIKTVMFFSIASNVDLNCTLNISFRLVDDFIVINNEPAPGTVCSLPLYALLRAMRHPFTLPEDDE